VSVRFGIGTDEIPGFRTPRRQRVFDGDGDLVRCHTSVAALVDEATRLIEQPSVPR
jgi:hypothetical protein